MSTKKDRYRENLRCMVIGCMKPENGKLSYHEFPGNRELSVQWCLALRIEGEKKGSLWQPSGDTRKFVCSQHFTPDDYTPYSKVKKLLRHAVPSIFPTYMKEKLKLKDKKPRRTLVRINKSADHIPELNRTVSQIKNQQAKLQQKILAQQPAAKVTTMPYQHNNKSKEPTKSTSTDVIFNQMTDQCNVPIPTSNFEYEEKLKSEIEIDENPITDNNDTDNINETEYIDNSKFCDSYETETILTNYITSIENRVAIKEENINTDNLISKENSNDDPLKIESEDNYEISDWIKNNQFSSDHSSNKTLIENCVLIKEENINLDDLNHRENLMEHDPLWIQSESQDNEENSNEIKINKVTCDKNYSIGVNSKLKSSNKSNALTLKADISKNSEFTSHQLLQKDKASSDRVINTEVSPDWSTNTPTVQSDSQEQNPRISNVIFLNDSNLQGEIKDKPSTATIKTATAVIPIIISNSNIVNLNQDISRNFELNRNLDSQLNVQINSDRLENDKVSSDLVINTEFISSDLVINTEFISSDVSINTLTDAEEFILPDVTNLQEDISSSLVNKIKKEISDSLETTPTIESATTARTPNIVLNTACTHVKKKRKEKLTTRKINDYELSVQQKQPTEVTDKPEKIRRKKEKPTTRKINDYDLSVQQKQPTEVTDKPKKFRRKKEKPTTRNINDYDLFLQQIQPTEVTDKPEKIRRKVKRGHIPCSICPKISTASQACKKCSKIFSSKKYLDLHMKKIHSRPNISDSYCKKCNIRFKYEETFHTHLKNVHNINVTIYCNFCTYASREKRYLAKHLQDRHLID